MRGKIHPLPRDKVIRILENNGFVRIKSGGPHLKFKKYDDTKKCIATTLVSHCPEIQPAIIKMIIKQSQKQEEEFY